MRIDKTFWNNVCMSAIGAVGIYVAVAKTAEQMKRDEIYIKTISHEINAKDPERCLRIGNNIKSGKIQNTVKDWQRELDIMKDSLRVDSLCRKAYFDGAQMVRDSIKNASKVIK